MRTVSETHLQGQSVAGTDQGVSIPPAISLSHAKGPRCLSFMSERTIDDSSNNQVPVAGGDRERLCWPRTMIGCRQPGPARSVGGRPSQGKASATAGRVTYTRLDWMKSRRSVMGRSPRRLRVHSQHGRVGHDAHPSPIGSELN